MDDPIMVATERPSQEQLDRLISDFTSASRSGDSWASTVSADDVRFCRWAGQRPDGKKLGTADRPAVPWDGASDTRPMTCDDVINDLVSLCTTAFGRAIASGKAGGSEEKGYAVALLDYLMNDRMSTTLMDEVELAAQYQQTYGWTVLHPVWEQEISLRPVCVKIEDLAQIGLGLAQADPGRFGYLANLPALLADPAQAEASKGAFRLVYGEWIKTQPELGKKQPELGEASLAKAVRELRTKGEAYVPVPYMARNEPVIYALKPWVEVLLPPDATDLQRARVVFQREFLTEAELQSRVLDEDYDPDWVEAALRLKGTQPNQTIHRDLGQAGQLIVAPADLVEVVHATYKATNDEGVPGVYCTTFHPQLKQSAGGATLYAKHECVGYDHGQLPYVLGKREHLARCVLATRGVPEVASTWQAEEKALRDGVIDWTSLGVLPPVNVYQDPKQLKYKFGPAYQNFVRLGKEPQFMQIPVHGIPAATNQLASLAVRRAHYFGTAHPEVPPEVTQVRTMRTVNRFLGMWVQAFRQVLSLCQQYMPDEEFAKVTGAPPGWLDSRRKAFGILTASLSFDTRELNEELMIKRLEYMNKTVLPGDSQGVIRRAKWTEIQVRAVNPAWVREVVQSEPEGSAALFDQVKNDIAQMFLGNAPQMVENDPTAQGKLQYAQQIVQANPYYMQALQEGKRFAQLMEAYTKNLGFSLTQENNKQIGRIGVQPVQ